MSSNSFSTKEKISTHVRNMYGRNIAVRALKSGFNREIFLYSDPKNKKKYVVSSVKSKHDSIVSMESYVCTMQFLQSAGCDFIPKVIQYNKKKEILIEEYVGTSAFNPKRMTKQQIQLFAKQLAQVHSYSFKDLVKFSRTHNFPKPTEVNPKREFKIFGKDRFLLAEKTCPSMSVINWIRPHIIANEKNIRTLSAKEKHVLWGDVGGNIRVSKNRLFFIDWEYTRIGSSSELAYTKIHTHFREKDFLTLLREYSKASGREYNDVLDEVAKEERIIRLNDVIWAAMKWGESKGSRVLCKKYETLTKKRIKLFEKYCS